jgi:hypothetical protein
MGKALCILFALIVNFSAYKVKSQTISFEFEKTPVASGFKMEGYWVWCGSMIKVGSVYHLFASRWPKSGPFPEGYKTNSEIVRATSKSPLGPFNFEEVVIGERDNSFWDANMAHNPTIHKIGNEFVLFYIGSDFTTLQEQSKALLRRVGYATASSIEGPWKRSDKPIIETESNNPAVLVEKRGVKLMYRDAKLRIFVAEAKSYEGPYRIVNDDVWPNCRLEDFYLFRTKAGYHMICEDNTGGISGHERWGVHLCSPNGTIEWQKCLPLVVYDHAILLDNDSILQCNRRERPQLLVENNRITHLVTSVFDGKNSWSQPVKLTHPIRVE